MPKQHTAPTRPPAGDDTIHPVPNGAGLLADMRIAFIRFDVLTRGSDMMADLVARRLRRAGAVVSMYHARRQYGTRLPLDAKHYRPLVAQSSVAVLAELALRRWAAYDVLVSDFIPLVYALHFRQRRRLIYYAQSHSVDCYRSRSKRRIMSRLYRRLLAELRVPVLCTSPRLARLIQEHYGIRPFVIREGDRRRLLAFVELAPSEAPAIRQRRCVLLALVGTNHAKGVDTLLRTLACLDRAIGPELEVWLAGAEASIQLVRSCVRHFGLLTPDELKALYLEADVFLFTSRFENYPSPPFEAMACDCPVVSTPVAEYLRHGDNALLARVGDAPGLAQAVVRVLRDPYTRDRLVQGGFETVEQTERELATATGVEADFLACVQAIPKQRDSLKRWTLTHDVAVAPG